MRFFAMGILLSRKFDDLHRANTALLICNLRWSSLGSSRVNLFPRTSPVSLRAFLSLILNLGQSAKTVRDRALGTSTSLITSQRFLAGL